MKQVDDLLASIFDGTNRALYEQFEGWVRSSKRFRAFATDYRTKIRAKLRNARGAEGMDDLRSELYTAWMLLEEERFTLEYEKYVALKQRGPDFTVTFKGHIPFNVEVRRMHSSELAEGDAEARAMKLIGVICDKAAQMPASNVNLLLLAAAAQIGETELLTATLTIRQLAEGKNDRFFSHYGYPSAFDFLKQYQRLSGVILCPTTASILWLNPLAMQRPAHDLELALRRLIVPRPS